MGYYSNFELDIIAGDDPTATPEFLDLFEKVTSYTFDHQLCDIKWYDSVKDMLTISSHYPRTIFSLTHEGEESGDIGIHYFHNGTYTGGQAQLIYPDFNHSDFTFANDYPELVL